MRAIVPAAGKGRRLQGSENLPKVLYKACGRPLLEVVLEQLSFLSPEDIYIVVGYRKEEVMAVCGDRYHYVEQKEQLGTGHAVAVCEDLFRDYDGTVLIDYGDMPLFRKEAMEEMCRYHEETGAVCTLMTAEDPSLTMWARIIRDENGRFARIVEGKDCTPEQAKTKELFAGVLAFDAKALFETLPLVDRNNVQGEYYLTEVPELLAKKGLPVETWKTDDPDDLRGVNTIEDLIRCEKVMRKRGMA
ncbi:MAG: NTP transferase domain-containing protein [Lachnospiraceae bacterium]|nr:NTP transferase domain-containing protein [Lachnospiraceae bacterium]